MPIKVGISMRVVNPVQYTEPRDAISHDWMDLLLSNDFEFILIPNCGEHVNEFLQSQNIQAIILSNGNDISDGNENIQFKDISKRRDLTENLILKWAIENNINILGVCRGAQLINIFYGGDLEYGIGDDHAGINHKVIICDKKTHKNFGVQTFITNSFHNQGMRKENLANKLIPFAISEDGMVEGYYVKNKKILAIQWHPERKFEDNHYNNKIPIEFLSKGPWWLGKNNK